MSAANCPETPRQKMIGMMYLFLTAMLALNVSKDILNAFVVVNKGLELTNSNFEQKNTLTMNAIDFAYSQDKEKVKPAYDASNEVKAKTEELVKYIRGLRTEVINKTAGMEEGATYGDTVKLQDVEAKDNNDVPTHFFMGESGTTGEAGVGDMGEGGKAPELRKKLQDYTADLKAILRGIGAKGIDQLGDLGINTKDTPKEDWDLEHPEENYWASSNFYHIPLAATVTVLTQMVNQVYNAEATVLNRILGTIGASDMKFDKLEARVVPKSTYVIQGGKYEADLFVAAWSSTSDPKVIVGPANQLDTSDSLNIKFKPGADTTWVKVVDGVGKYERKATSLGEQKYASIIEVKNTSTGEVISYPLKVEDNYYAQYMVAKPSAVISPTKMNVFYIGVDNPVSISVPGFAANKVYASISGGSIVEKNKAKGEYIVKVSKRGKVVVSVMATDENGKRVPIGKQEFRVKKVPDPVAKVAGKTSGSVVKSKLATASNVLAEMENFDFEMKAIVTGFTVSANIGGYEQSKKSTSYKITPDQRAIIKKAKRGTRVTFERITASVAGGKRKLRDISLKLK